VLLDDDLKALASNFTKISGSGIEGKKKIQMDGNKGTLNFSMEHKG